MASDVWYIKWTREGRVYLMGKIQKIKELTEELLYHCHLYYDLDAPEISDAEYDKKFDELKHLEDEANFWLANSPTRTVQGQVLESFQKVTHSKPMLSAAKTKDINEIKRFIGNNNFYCSYKLDGLTLVCSWYNGKFQRAVTRGTGLIGEDVTEQAKMIENLPMTIPYDNYIELRGECVVSWDNFNKINESLTEPYSHPRNLAAGSLRNLDTNITRRRKLSYIVFECVSGLYDEETSDKDWDSKWEQLAYLDHLGFTTVKRCIGNVDDCVREMSPELYEFPVDGLIFELNSDSYSKSLSATTHHEGCRMALKWSDDEYSTTLRRVEWSTTKSGIVAPVAIFDEVDLSGALTTRATLHNVSIIRQLELGIGDEIVLIRSNMVIPKIIENNTRSNTLTLPTHCPSCGTELELKNTGTADVLYCPNERCPSRKLALFEHFVSKKALNIDGLSEATIEFLINKGWIHTFKDLYHLIEYKSEWQKCDGFGKKSVEKILDAIEKSRNVDLAHFITALSIPGIGSSAAKTISEACNGSWDILWDMWNHEYDFTQLDDIGEITANSLVKFFNEHINDINRLSDEMHFTIEEKKEIKDNPFIGKSICCTGKLEHFTRDSINEKIVELGAKVASGVTSKTDFLINNDPNSNSSKNNNARKFGTKIITEEEFLNLIGG